ncbi:MAG: trigger factor [Alphaproteobacteria bacterium]
MQVTETLNDGLKREFKIVLPAADIERKIDDKLKEFGATARIPGFRPGKAPMTLLKGRFGDAVRGEVLQEAVNTSSTQTITERGLRPAMQPHLAIVSAEPGADLAFTIAVEVLPEITPIDFRTLSLERLEVGVADGDVETELGRRAASMRRTEPVSRASAKDDVVVIDFSGVVDGKELPGGKGEGHHLALGSNSFIPGFEDQLMGASAGDMRTVDVTFPESYANKDLQGKKARFEVTVKEVREPKAAAIDDELAKAMGLENLDALKAAVRKDLESAYVMLARSRAKRKLFDTLTEVHDFPLPPGMIDMEFEGIWQQLQQDKAAGRSDPEDGAKSEDELKAEYRRIAERRVRLGLLLSEVGRANKISVSADEMSKALAAEARRYPGNERQVMEFYGKNPSAADALRAPLLEDKVVDYILELVQISKRTVTAEEFAKADTDDIAAATPAEGGAGKAGKRKSAKAKTGDA